jgi:hypothetical protein
MPLRVLCVVIAVLALTSATLAQWLHHPTPGIPRLPDGKPNLRAPAPRAADGRPDLSGVWAAERNRPPALVGSGFVGNRLAGNIAADLPGGAPLTVWGRTVYDERRNAARLAIPTERCLPSGIPPDMLRPQLPFKLVQTGSLLVVLLEEFNNWRQIHLDGRALPRDPEPAFFGHSVGQWDGDALMITTVGMNEKTWLDGGGLPHSEALRLTERIRRIDFGRMEITYTFDDPKAFTKPWSATVRFDLEADSELMDNQCENDHWKANTS